MGMHGCQRRRLRWRRRRLRPAGWPAGGGSVPSSSRACARPCARCSHGGSSGRLGEGQRPSQQAEAAMAIAAPARTRTPVGHCWCRRPDRWAAAALAHTAATVLMQLLREQRGSCVSRIHRAACPLSVLKRDGSSTYGAALPASSASKPRGNLCTHWGL